MRTESPVELNSHREIANVLDEVRDQGLISDYLVSWRGRDGRLEPKVAVWSDAESPAERVRDEILQSLLGLVPSRGIIVLDNSAVAPDGGIDVG